MRTAHSQGVVKKPLICLVLLAGALLASPGVAQWSTDPANPLIVGYGSLPQVCSDSTGGCYITYQVNTNYPRYVDLARLNRYGYLAWGAAKQIHGLLSDQNSAQVIEDGQNGAIIAYLDEYEICPSLACIFADRLRVQRVDSSGRMLWGDAGVRVTLSETNQSAFDLASDNHGGCFVTWHDTGSTLWSQRITSSGVRAWGDSGVFVAYSDHPAFTSSNKSIGLMIEYYSFGAHEFRRINADGRFPWPNEIGNPIGAVSMVSNEMGNTYVLGGNYIGFVNNMSLFSYNLQRIDSAGAAQWDSLGIAVDTINTNLTLPTNLILQEGSATMGWSQMRNGRWDTRYQIIRRDGSQVFPDSGVWISDTASQKLFQCIIDCGQFGTMLIWGDNRPSGLGIYAQRVDTSGRRAWTSEVPLDLQSIGGLTVTGDGNGGGILVGDRETDFTIRAQQINRDGVLGNIISRVNEKSSRIHAGFVLYECYPNPFNPSSVISYELATGQYLSIKVYDVLGQQRALLFEGRQKAGQYSVRFDGSGLASGVYLVRVTTEHSGSMTRKAVLIK